MVSTEVGTRSKRSVDERLRTTTRAVCDYDSTVNLYHTPLNYKAKSLKIQGELHESGPQSCSRSQTNLVDAKESSRV